jgi:hypothetical protein
MATKLEKDLERELVGAHGADHRGTPLVIRLTKEGILMKVKGQHWEGAALLPWGSAYTAACIKKVNSEKAEKKLNKQLAKA